ncbi:hypothetical protein KUCAC02_029285, partial [Chaenocephalus aceratus]
WTALELEWPEQDRQLPGPGAHREKERRGAWGAGEGLCSAPDDTPDAPAQPPLSATFTSLPSGQ